ncbi:FecCD family ABC transporter permease [Paracoccus shanxieyensis]|uniref:Iron chelate uptake ABC transporter family permease subunit n=1 Tax=Paracoccus shanxieyensis TaxID=2675752 RepID=A0A6L6J1F9_9RHOB|nr:iron ABC transporter permease [Paracoccus shanxieyensis]MTH65989.1 iron chelate uptake ABC transporter family permease subunit [Paracoccus shanxieyensis]MTH89027.1 iron chelate uptake ABC transporter family permease subunit [Paracoccus shanxieyensis]
MRAVWALLLAGLLAAFLAAIAMGDQRLGLGQVLAALTGAPDTPAGTRMIVTGLRLPRALMAVLVGASLGVAGAVCQAIMRNPLAEPGLLGINAGAALAATAIIIEFRTIPQDLLPVLTFAGALAMSAAIYAFSWRQGTSSVRIILIGIGLGALAGAGASFISTFGDPPAVQRAMIWLSGSLQDSRWERVRMLALWAILPFVAAWLIARELDLIAFGDTVARGLGQRVNLLRGMAVLICASLAGAAVAAAGLVGFVGLAAPHLARRLVGHAHARLIPASALVGAILVLVADLAARRIMPPVQLPVGLFTALLGAPFFGFLLWKRRND